MGRSFNDFNEILNSTNACEVYADKFAVTYFPMFKEFIDSYNFKCQLNKYLRKLEDEKGICYSKGVELE
jgi:hypothetical protein